MMRNAFSSLVVSGLAALFLVAPGFAGDGDQCKKGEDCCKMTGKACGDAKSGNGASKDGKADKAKGRVNKLTKFTFQQSGGFAGVNKQYQVNLADLSESERNSLAQLIDKSGLLKAQTDEKRTKSAADMFVYTFSAEDGNKTHSITFDDGTLPAEYRSLVDFSKDKMVDLKR
ncbi:MAG: protealysin inhibitor emfourin [Candidatus Melainabacteria bacterium]|nr:protealysin inhibitor emfourin [Candidatus Melainabacteria bacterium]